MTDGLAHIEEGGVVAVMRGADADTVIETAEALAAGGVTAIEVTADTPGVADLVADVAGAFDDEVLVGAGTVLDAETARTLVLAGAEFVVCPSVHADVVELCNRYDVTVLPGAMTPTEIVGAYEAGADAVKVFPAATLGPGHVSALGGPLGHIPLVPTGGVDLDNVADFVGAGALAVGVGSALIDREAVAAGDFGAIEETAEAFRREIARAREKHTDTDR